MNCILHSFHVQNDHIILKKELGHLSCLLPAALRDGLPYCKLSYSTMYLCDEDAPGRQFGLEDSLVERLRVQLEAWPALDWICQIPNDDIKLLFPPLELSPRTQKKYNGEVSTTELLTRGGRPGHSLG